MARVKQIGKSKANGRKQQANGTSTAGKRAPAPAAPATPASATKTPTAAAVVPKPAPLPTDLSDAERAKLKSWLDHQPRPFGVATMPASRKRKRGSVGAAGGPTGGGPSGKQEDLFDRRLEVQFEVRPADKWECLRRYKKFTVGSESIATGQCILVKHDDLDESQMDVASQWKAKVLEVRALDSEHVYIRVAWLNRPEDLVGGRKPYHGKYELIPTNQMDVIDAMTVNGSLEVQKWNEKDDDSPSLAVDEFFWRQTYDVVNIPGGAFSDLRKICVDQEPQNPDELILQCGSADCRKWMHVKCIAETAAHAAAHPHATTPAKKAKKSAHAISIPVEAGSKGQAKAQSDSYTAEVLIKSLPQGGGGDLEPATATEIVITDAGGEQRSEDVRCLFCRTRID